MKRVLESGTQKRKRKAEKDQEAKKITKLDEFFTKVEYKEVATGTFLHSTVSEKEEAISDSQN